MNDEMKVRFFSLNDDKGKIKADATHLWKKHPNARGAARFGYIYRLCRVVSVDDGATKIRLTGLRSRPLKMVPSDEIICLSDIDPKGLPLSA